MLTNDHAFVIPVYGDSPYLEQCIQSLMSQTVKSKIIITTSTPSGYIKTIAFAYGLPYFINNNSQAGIAADWNFALTNADAKLVTIAHQDDIYQPAYTGIVTAQFKASEKKTLMCFTDYNEIVNDKTRGVSLNAMVKKALLMPFILKRNIALKFIKKLVLLVGNPVCCPSVTLNMEVHQNFRFSENYSYVLDWYAWYKLAQLQGAFAFINKKLVKHRIHPGSETTLQLNSGKRKVEELRLFELIWGKWPAKIIAGLYSTGHKDNLSN